MDLQPLIFKVRSALSDMPESYIDDSAVLNDLKRAQMFVDLIKMDTITPAQENTCLIVLGSYYSYMTWTSLAEKQLGELPYNTTQKAIHLRSMARSFLSLISKYPLAEDLSVDMAMINGQVVAFKLCPTVVEDVL